VFLLYGYLAMIHSFRPFQSLTDYPYGSGRRVVMGSRGAVATSQPLAAQAGMEMLWAGGNAVDAAVAMAIALTVLEPTSNGIGGDAFALVWDGELHGLNASGRSAAGLTAAHWQELSEMPQLGWLSVTVPGAVSGWRSLWERWGNLPFEQLFAPAIRYAREGFPVSPETAISWQRAESLFLSQRQPLFAPFQATFFAGDRAPKVGEIWASPAHANTLTQIATSGGDAFYRGELAQRLVAFAAQTGGLLTLEDLAQHQADWVTPISTHYRGVEVWEMPPNTQGLATLLALNILQTVDLAQYPRESVQSYHWQIEAMKLAFADAYAYIADPAWMTMPPQVLLSPAYGRDRAGLIGDCALPLASAGQPQGGTVYLAAADGDLIVSFIQSNYLGFGSGLVVPETGIALHNRGMGFSLEPGHPNQIAPHKRPFHTIIPGFLTCEGQPLGAFGVMGAPMQPQGHVQTVVNLVDYGFNPQAALDAPRWRWVDHNRVMLERAVADEIAQGLSDLQHQVRRGGFLGRGQIILRYPAVGQGASGKSVFVAASEPRADGLAIAW
jgi:gamma-glutamyltranspeptidase / glutathione hydrolase